MQIPCSPCSLAEYSPAPAQKAGHPQLAPPLHSTMRFPCCASVWLPKLRTALACHAIHHNCPSARTMTASISSTGMESPTRLEVTAGRWRSASQSHCGGSIGGGWGWCELAAENVGAANREQRHRCCGTRLRTSWLRPTSRWLSCSATTVSVAEGSRDTTRRCCAAAGCGAAIAAAPALRRLPPPPELRCLPPPSGACGPVALGLASRAAHKPVARRRGVVECERARGAKFRAHRAPKGSTFVACNSVTDWRCEHTVHRHVAVERLAAVLWRRRPATASPAAPTHMHGVCGITLPTSIILPARRAFLWLLAHL